MIAFTVIFDIGKNYEKGAFGVPNELDEINGIWREFDEWKIPQWVVEEVEKNSIIDAELNGNFEEQEEVKQEVVEETEAAIEVVDEITDKVIEEATEEEQTVTVEVAEVQEEKNEMEEVKDEQEKQEIADIGANLQEEQEKVEAV